MKFFVVAFIYVFILVACGEGNSSKSDEDSNDESEVANSNLLRPPSNPIVKETQPIEKQLSPVDINRYNELKSASTLPLNPDIKTFTCAKEGMEIINLTRNEYTYPISPVPGSALLCDFLKQNQVASFASTDQGYCEKRLQEEKTKLEEEGYTCEEQLSSGATP